MSRVRKQGAARASRRRASHGPWVPTLVVFLLVGALAWRTERRPEPTRLLIGNGSVEARAVDVVWKDPGGGISGTLLRVIEPGDTLRQVLRSGWSACVRWIDDASASVEGAWPVPPALEPRTVVLSGPPLASAAARHACAPELAEHRIRPRLGRWMNPGDPDGVHRERIIPRILHRRTVRRRASRRRSGRGGFPSWAASLPSSSGKMGSRRVTYWHLTPRGWVRGGWETLSDAQPDRPPDDRVMSCIYVEGRPTNLVRATREVSTVWSGDPVLARRLTRRFGRCPRGHDRAASRHSGSQGA